VQKATPRVAVKPLLLPEEMAAADRAAIEAGTPIELLMDRAGRAVVRAVIRLAGGRYGRRVAVVCGKGNNGGDGFVAARIARREGLAVRCLFVGDRSAVKGAAGHHLALMEWTGVALEEFHADALRDAHVIVDAMFGTGFKGRAQGAAVTAIDSINEAAPPIVAVDIPSGVDGSSGAVEGSAVKATTTVAMAAMKVGTAVGAGAVHSGTIEVVDIGIPVSGERLWLAESSDVASILPRRRSDSHKRSRGAVALLAGSSGMSGAVVLTARAAVRSGAGYATAGVTAAVEPIVSGAVPEVLTRTVTSEQVLGPDALDEFKPVLERADVLAIGPGLGTGARQTELVIEAIKRIEVPLVIDADGLNVLAGRTDELSARSAPAVITPHPAELARLLECSTDDVQANRLYAVETAAARLNCVVVLKGHRTLVGDPTGKVVVNPTGGPELATAGTGDVLTGIVAALLAGGTDPFLAAVASTFVHGLAGSVAAERIGESGVLAGDVAESVPAAVARLR
jgi:ADP-dependent NAD(P)H-hydrate dehydratase / NAD(P)H-hydrate epimerase